MCKEQRRNCIVEMKSTGGKKKMTYEEAFPD